MSHLDLCCVTTTIISHINIARVEGNDVATDDCLVFVEIGVPEFVLAFVSMPRDEEGMGRTNSTFSLVTKENVENAKEILIYIVFLWPFVPCFRPGALVFTLIAATDESPPLMFCPLYHFTNSSRAPSFSVTATVCEQICLGLKFLHVHVALKL